MKTFYQGYILQYFPPMENLPYWEFGNRSRPTVPIAQLGIEERAKRLLLFGTNMSTIGALPKSGKYLWEATAGSAKPVMNLRPDPDAVILGLQWNDSPNSIHQIPTLEELQAWTADAFLEEVYTLARANDLEGATDLIFDRIDRLLCDGAFQVCDAILSRVNVKLLPTALMRSFLTITGPAKAKLPARKALFAAVHQEMVRLRGEEKAKRLLDRLA